MEGFENFGLDIDADGYAEAAADDIPSAPRTYQSEEQFQVIRMSYTAKHDGNNSYAELLEQLPPLRASVEQAVDKNCRPKLDKKQQLLLGYAAGELYYHKRYTELLDLCSQLKTHYQVDPRLLTSLERWSLKCKGKLS